MTTAISASSLTDCKSNNKILISTKKIEIFFVERLKRSKRFFNIPPDSPTYTVCRSGAKVSDILQNTVHPLVLLQPD
jgi:hypothetical protein